MPSRSGTRAVVLGAGGPAGIAWEVGLVLGLCESGLPRLRSAGAAVDVVHPDASAEGAFAAVGGDLLDPSVREIAARAGRAQGHAIADSLTAFSRGSGPHP